MKTYFKQMTKCKKRTTNSLTNLLLPIYKPNYRGLEKYRSAARVKLVGR